MSGVMYSLFHSIRSRGLHKAKLATSSVFAFLLFFIAALAVISPVPALAVSGRNVIGTVRGSGGASVVSASVTVELQSTHARKRTTTDARGGFQFAGLPVGAYLLSVDSPGYGHLERRLIVGEAPVAGVKLDIKLPAASQSENLSTRPQAGNLQVRPINPVHYVTTNAPRVTIATPKAALGNAKGLAATTNAAAMNSPADFSIYSPVLASNPPRFGFNVSGPGPIADNTWLSGGITAYDSPFALSASQDGSDTTFIATHDNGNPGTDYYSSIGTGYFVGGHARVYRYTNGSWSLLRTANITGYTAVSSSDAVADHTVTFDASGPATKSGDVLWMDLDNVANIPNVNYFDPRFSAFYLLWNTETQNGWNRGDPQPYTLDTDVPAADPGGLSLKLSDSKTELQGIWNYLGNFECPTDEEFEPGHTYEISVWLKQSGISDGNATFNFTLFNLSHTFTGINSTWQHFTWDFPAPACLPANFPAVTDRLDFNAPGTLWIDSLSLSDTSHPAYTLDPRVQQAWADYQPGTMRIWSNFSSNAGSYQFWSLDSWLTPESQGRSAPGIGNQFETDEIQEHLPTSLAYAKNAGADPWLIVNMALSEQEWGDLIDYLAAPAGVGYASRRPADHPGPYTDDFNHIYLEVGNEEWGTQQTPVNFAYGQWAHFLLSTATAGKSYYDPAKLPVIVNGFFLQPSFGSAAATAAPEASYVDYALYTSGDDSLTGDPYYQSDLIQLPASNQGLIDAMVAQQKLDSAAGHPYGLAGYEAGPGQDTTVHNGDTSLAAGVAALDVNLYAQLRGFGPINLFLFNLGSGPYTSHSNFANGFRPHPVWEALQMRNQYAAGDMVWTVPNSVPTTSDANQYPLIGVYAYHDTSNGGNQADVIVISRDLNNATPVTVHLPGTPAGSATLYTLTGDPRANNDTSMQIPIGTQTLTGVTQDLSFTMPPGSVYLFQVPITGSWSTAVPAPGVPQNLRAVADNGKVALTWSSVDGASTYAVKRATVTGGPYTTVASPTGPAYTDTSVTNGVTYYYVISAVNVGGASANSTEVSATPNVADIPFTSVPPPLDGTDSGAWTSAPSFKLVHDFNTYTPDTASYKALWDANYLYVLAEVVDSTLTHSPSVYDGDSVEIYFSGTDNKSTSYGPTDFQYAFPYGGTNDAESHHNALAGVKFAQGSMSGGYRLVIAIPWTTLGTTPTSNQQYGFDVMVNDAVSPGNRDGKLAWWGTEDQTYHDPSLMGPAILTGGENLASTATTLTVSPNTALITGAPYTLTAAVAPLAGSETPAGTVTFSILGPYGYGKTVKAALDSTGQASYTIAAPFKGSYQFSATYNGSSDLAGSVSAVVTESAVGIPTTTTIVTTPSTGLVYGQPWTITANVTAPSGQVVNYGNVVFQIGSVNKTISVDSTGKAVYSGLVPYGGAFNIQASYGGSPVFASNTATASASAAAAQSTTTLSISPNSTFAAGAPWTLTANVKSTSGSPVSTGTVTFYLAGPHPRNETHPVNASGIATAPGLAPLDGTYTLTAVYNGSANYSGSTSTPIQEVISGKVTATTTVLTQTPSTNLTAGAPWTLNASVIPTSGGATPTGSVTFIWDTGSATSNVDASGKASYTGVVPPVGTHSVYAKYSGSPAFGPSTSNTIQFTSLVAVTGTTTTLTINPAGSVASGQTLTLTAVVAPATGTAAPSGSVTFSIGSTTANATLDSTGTATYTTTAPTSGTYSVSASYAGAPGFSGSASQSTQLVVTAALPQVSLAAAANVTGIFIDGVATYSSGLDGLGYAYSSTQLGQSITVSGVTFAIGTPNQNDVVNGTNAPAIALPPGKYSTLSFLGGAVNGSQNYQLFTVTYTDGTTTQLNQGLSDWYAPQAFTGENIAKAMPYRDINSGQEDQQTFNLYEYVFPLDNTKTVQSFTLPNNSNVFVVAATLTP